MERPDRADGEFAHSLNVADIHKKYDRQFRQMMHDMFRDLNAVIATDQITEVEATFVTESLARRTAGQPGIEALLLTDASLDLRVKYGG